MKKLLTLCCAAMVLVVTDLSAATVTQKAAFRAEKKARAASVEATKKAVAAINKANTLEAKAATLLAALPPGSTVKTPVQFVTARCDAAQAKATEFFKWTEKTKSQIATARDAWNAAEKAAIAAEKAAYNALTPAEKDAYKASLAAAVALEAAGDAADDAITKADYANMSFAERVDYNDTKNAQIGQAELWAASLSPAQFLAADAAYHAQLYADMKDFYLEVIALAPTARLDDLASKTALDPDPATADEVDIENGARFE